MHHPIVRLVGLILSLLLPPSGRRRREAAPPPQAPPAHVCTRVPLLRGEGSPLVRPYLDTPATLRARRRALWLATHGVDVGPRLIHGVEVA
ncbi:hypothetical protein [Streptomyces sp. NPDC056144]|uniref:hypothetical protein n=1 Tax=unclassified Streptomyces TaxID=2593676 RepID=UPI0035DA3D7E